MSDTVQDKGDAKVKKNKKPENPLQYCRRRRKKNEEVHSMSVFFSLFKILLF